MKQLEEREAGKFSANLKKAEDHAADLQDRLNNIQNMIFKANEKIDQFKLEMNWNQEELEQWALASRQKEEDNVTLEKYKRGDESKIKELQLNIEKMTMEVSRQMLALEKEVTETRAAQIQLDKTAEECARVHEERRDIYQQLVEVVKLQEDKKSALVKIGKELGSVTVEVNQRNTDISNKKDALANQIKANKQKETDILVKTRTEEQDREKQRKEEKAVKDLEDEVRRVKTELSAHAMTLTQKRNELTLFSQRLDEQKERLLRTKTALENTRKLMSRHEEDESKVRATATTSKETYSESEKAVKAKTKDLEKLKVDYIKVSQKLLNLGEEEVKGIAIVGGQMANRKNLLAKIKVLNDNMEKQEETLYSVDYKIQEINRKITLASGEGTKEQKDHNMKIKKDEEAELDKKHNEEMELRTEIRKIEDETKGVQRKIDEFVEKKTTLDSTLHNLKLETDMLATGVQGLIKKKEAALLSHDLMKLEIKKRAEIVSLAANEAIGEDNKKAQLEMSLEEREKEIHVYKEVLTAELKAAEDERHRIAGELQQRNSKVKTLKIRYESLLDKNKGRFKEEGGDGDHSQAYYVIKAAQEKEELQRFGDELDGKINKCQKEKQALMNTLEHLKKRNRDVREKFTAGTSKESEEKKAVLEEQCRAASETLFKKRKELQRVQKEWEDLNKRLVQTESHAQNVGKQMADFGFQNEKLSKELQEQKEKIQRASKAMIAKKQALLSKVPDFGQSESTAALELQLQTEKLRNNYMLNALRFSL